MLLGWWLFDTGYDQGAGDLQQFELDQVRLQQQVGQLLDLKDQHERQLVIVARAQQVDKQAYADVEQELLALQSKILALREDLSFYRGIMAPEDMQVGLRIQSFEVAAGIAPGYFDYQLLLVQIKRNSRFIRGAVEMQVEGEQDGVPVTLDLKTISEPVIRKHSFKFRYFQSIAGQMHLPDGFSPHSVRIRVIPSSRPGSMLKWTYKWAI
ncbi:MAG: hypothetical protein GXP22_06850 [Gammaproteobacteria bacterium]|nr:hypothetical protein [Gammaproteobacteria bacterium]